MPQSKLEKNLLKLYDDKVEHVGFILSNGKLVEVENTSSAPEESFDVSGEDILKYEKTAVASWHTHPGGDSNLSVGDMETFLNWPEWEHYIIGNDGITKFIVKDGEVLVG